jgi:hypothetical protein
VLPAFAAALLGACAGDSTRYPSLAIRDAERVTGTIAPATPDDTAAPAIASTQEIAALVASARASHRRFLAAQPGAAQLARSAAGRGIESEAHARALVSLADLTALRSQTAIALGDLDLIEAETGNSLAPVAEINAAQAEVAAFVNEEDAVLGALAAQIAP